jgi:hypothetical protein
MNSKLIIQDTVEPVEAKPVTKALELLDIHYEAFFSAAHFATATKHPVPMDTRGWSQILVSVLCGINGVARQKGADLADGSDVKGANTWEAIDTPRFNGVIKAGTKAATSDRIDSLDFMPHLYFVLWDETVRQTARCRIWAVRPQYDAVFRAMCETWYAKRLSREIVSSNFQLHPPRGRDSNVFRNTCGNLSYPLYFCAERARGETYRLVHFDDSVRNLGLCTVDGESPRTNLLQSLGIE